MKKQPKAVYIIENGGYNEFNHEEIFFRGEKCPVLLDKMFLPLFSRPFGGYQKGIGRIYLAKG